MNRGSVCLFIKEMYIKILVEVVGILSCGQSVVNIYQDKKALIHYYKHVI